MTGDWRLSTDCGLLIVRIVGDQKAESRREVGEGEGLSMCVCEPLTACGGYAQTRRSAGEVGSW